MIIKQPSWVINWVAALAASRWTIWCLHCFCVPANDTLQKAPINWHDSNLLSPCWGDCVGMICWSWIGEGNNNKKKWEVLRIINLASSQNGISNSQLAPSTQEKTCCLWVQAPRVSQSPIICSKSVWCRLIVYRYWYKWFQIGGSVPGLGRNWIGSVEMCFTE